MENNKIIYKGIEYTLVFNLNAMEEIQEEYGSIEKWGTLTDGSSGEVNAKALIFGLRAMLNEGIDIDNEDNAGVEGYVKKKALSLKAVGRLLTEVGLAEATNKLNKTVVESTKSDEKN
jgi:hypothetical protein